MSEGRTRAEYVPDNSNIGAFIVDVPNNLFAQADLGWAAPTSAGTYTRRPRLFRPRHIEGVASSGKHYRVLVGSNTADLWTGAATTWTTLDNAGATITVTITGYIGESGTIDVIPAEMAAANLAAAQLAGTRQP